MPKQLETSMFRVCNRKVNISGTTFLTGPKVRKSHIMLDFKDPFLNYYMGTLPAKCQQGINEAVNSGDDHKERYVVHTYKTLFLEFIVQHTF